MRIQPQLFITPKNNTNNLKQQNSTSKSVQSGTYNPLYYRDYNINFKARLFRTPANFYAQPFNQTGMPKTMKDYLNDDYEDRQNIPPAQMMKIVFEPIKMADTLEDVKEIFPDEPLFDNLTTTPKRKARIGVIAEIDLMKDENTKLFKNSDDTLGLYLLKKIYLEGKSLKEINKDFQNDISPDFNGLSPIDYTTITAYGIKMPNQGFWKSFLATREDFPYEYKPRKAYERSISAPKTEKPDLSLEDIKKLPPNTNSAAVKRKGKFDDVKEWEIDKLADAMISGRGNEDETRKILKKKNIKDAESSNFVMKYMWAIMPVVLEKTNASAEMKNFWATYDTTNKSQKDIMSAYWRTTPQMQALQSLMMKDTIKMFMEAYGVDGNNEEFQQLLQYPVEIAERRKQFEQAHELKQKYYDEMFAELDALEAPQEAKAKDLNQSAPVSEKPEPAEEFTEISINPATGDIKISEAIEKRFNQKLLDELDIFPSQYKNKYIAFLNQHPLTTNELKLVSVVCQDDIQNILPDLLTNDSIRTAFNIIDQDFTEAEPVLFKNLRQAFIDTLTELHIENAENLYWEDNFGGLREGAALVPDTLKDKFKKIMNSKYNLYKQPLSNSEALKITNAVMQSIINIKPDEISTKNKYMHEAFMIVQDALNPQMRKELKAYIQKNDIISKQGGNMRILLDNNVSEAIKKEKVVNLISTENELAAFITGAIINLTATNPELYYQLKQLKNLVDSDLE